MPQRLCNALATFQRHMNWVLRKYVGRFCAVYIDDIAAYVEAAQRLGMGGVQFQSPAQLTSDLKSLGVELP